MTNSLENIDDVAMRDLYEKEGAKLSYEEWFAMRLVNHHMGDTEAIVFMDGSSLPGKTADSNPAEEGSSPSAHANTQKSKSTQKNTDKIKKSSVSDEEQEAKDRVVYGTSVRHVTPENPEGKVIPVTQVFDETPFLAGNKDDVIEIEPDVTIENVEAPVIPKKPVELAEHTDPESITPDMFGLTPKQLQFCWEYIKDFNGARAVRESGYTVKGVDAQSTQAGRLLGNAGVQHCMAQLMKLRRDRVKRKPSASELAKSADLVLERVAEMANYDLNDFMKIGKDGLAYYDFSDATPEMIRGMTGLKIKQGIQMEYTDEGEPDPRPVYDVEAKGNPLKASELLMRHHGLLTERVVVEDNRDLDAKDVARRLAFMLQKAKQEGADG